MLKLGCNVQKYNWGRRGTNSKVALYKSAQDNQFKIEDSQAYAELWMGTHSNCPSNVDDILLSDYLKKKGDAALGSKISQHFYDRPGDSTLKLGDLPFLFKVLSINQALSIQAHPNKSLASTLHQRDPKNYPDSNHKPEMLIALSNDFEAMCGFRLSSEIIDHFANYTELVVLCDAVNCDEFKQKPSELSLRKCFESMMTKSDELVSEQIQKLKNRIDSQPKTSTKYLDALFLRLASQYTNDVGCFSIFLLNCLKLEKGEAIFLSANVPHAYLFGDGVECMATSDNVVRAGLTPKFKDVSVLCEMLDYGMRSAEDNKLTAIKSQHSHLIAFRPPAVDEFSVQQIRIDKVDTNLANFKFLIPKCESGSILIITEIESLIKFTSYFCLDNNERICNLAAGLVYFIDAMTDVYFVVEMDSQKAEEISDNHLLLLAYRAYVDIKK
jgi:mannose-6-phosphate isomerase